MSMKNWFSGLFARKPQAWVIKSKNANSEDTDFGSPNGHLAKTVKALVSAKEQAV